MVVRQHQVPILVVGLEKSISKFWDLTVKRVILYINGINSVKRIAELSCVRIDLVRICVRHLVYYITLSFDWQLCYGCVQMVDIFQFSNVYAPRQRLNTLLDNAETLSKCREFIAKPGCAASLSLSVIFSLYCSLRHGVSIKEWIREFDSPVLIDIDIRRFVIYGVLNGYIYRVHRYVSFPFSKTAIDTRFVTTLPTCPVPFNQTAPKEDFP